MPGTGRRADLGGGPGEVWHPIDLQEGAITPRPEGKPGMVAGSRAGYAGHLNVVDLRGHVALRPRGVIGLRQVDGMPHRAPS